MRKIKLQISYDGEVFYGMQKQNNFEPTVQSVMEEAFSEICKESISISYAGRTDRGVHAKRQVVCFEDQGHIPLKRFKKVLQNSLKGFPIEIISAEEIDSSFHPRIDALTREYEYWLYSGTENVFLNKYMLYVDSMDVERMNQYANCFLGEKDFALFCKSSAKYENTFRKVFNAEIIKSSFSFLGYKGTSYMFKVKANGFLHNMVRRMVGVLLEAMKDGWKIEEFQRVIEQDKKFIWEMVPAKGLFLTNVKY